MNNHIEELQLDEMTYYTAMARNQYVQLNRKSIRSYGSRFELPSQGVQWVRVGSWLKAKESIFPKNIIQKRM